MRRIGLPNLSVLLLAVGAIAAAIAIPASASSDGKSGAGAKNVARTVVLPAKAPVLRGVSAVKGAKPLRTIRQGDAPSLTALPARGHGHGAGAIGGPANCH